MINWIEKNTGWFILIVVAMSFIAPRILTIKTNIEWLHFNDPVGDTIGGITAPILNFLSIILLYLTLRKQNSDFNNQREYDLINKNIENIQSSFDNMKIVLSNVNFEGREAFKVAQNLMYRDEKIKLNPLELAELGSFINDFGTLKHRIIRLLAKNLSSFLTKDEKEIFYDSLIPIFTSLVNFNSVMLGFLPSLTKNEGILEQLINLTKDDELMEKLNRLNPRNN